MRSIPNTNLIFFSCCSSSPRQRKTTPQHCAGVYSPLLKMSRNIFFFLCKLAVHRRLYHTQSISNCYRTVGWGSGVLITLKETADHVRTHAHGPSGGSWYELVTSFQPCHHT